MVILRIVLRCFWNKRENFMFFTERTNESKTPVSLVTERIFDAKISTSLVTERTKDAKVFAYLFTERIFYAKTSSSLVAKHTKDAKKISASLATEYTLDLTIFCIFSHSMHSGCNTLECL